MVCSDHVLKELPVSKKPKQIVISVLNQKGGVGKTTIATNLAHGLIISGISTLLVDGDPQGSARDWHEANGAELVPCVGLDRDTLPIDLVSISQGYQVVVIDGAPQIAKLSFSAVKASDVVLIPVQPSPYDVWATADLVDMIKSRQEITQGRPKAAFLISRNIKNTKIGKDVHEALVGYDFPILNSKTSQHVYYAQSASLGLSVFSDKSLKENKVKSLAAIEFLAIVNEIIEKYINI